MNFNSAWYCDNNSRFQTPPLRLLLLGPIASGKTTVGRCTAKHLGIFHVSFQEYLQEEILSKMKKPPLIDDDDWELAGELAEEKQEDEGIIMYGVQCICY